MLVTGIGLLGAGSAATPHVSRYLGARLGRGVVLVSQRRLYSAVNGFDGLARFENPAFLDRLRLAQQAARAAPGQATASIFAILQSVVSMGGFLAVLLAVSPVMVAITVTAAVPTLLVQVAISRQHATMMWQTSPRNRRQVFYQMLMLNLAAVKEIRLFRLGSHLQDRMLGEIAEVNRAEERVDRRLAVSQGPLALLGAAVTMGGLIWMVARAADGGFSTGDVSAFIAAVAGVQVAVTSAVSAGTDCYRALLPFGHYLDVSAMASDLPAPEHPVAPPALRRGVALDNVWFRYTEGGPWVLRGVSMTIEYGTSIALVGLNGSGKSTLVKLLCRLYDPSHGSIRWDGVDLRELDVASLRDRISAVFQDYMSYDLSAAENIGLGDLAHLDDRDRVVQAARRADLDESLEQLPRGYDTLLSRTFSMARTTAGASGA